MKWTVKKLKEEVARLKALWLDKRKAKESADAIKTSADYYKSVLSVLEEAEADGKKDDELVEVPEPTAAKGGEADSNIVELDTIKAAITESVKAEIAKMDAKFSGQITADQITNIVAAEFAKQKVTDATKATAASIKTIAVDSLNEVIANFKRSDGTKMLFDGSRDQHDLSIPDGRTEGNLTVCDQQLKNILLNRPMNQGIGDALLRKAADADVAFYGRLSRQGAKALTTAGTGTGLEFIPTTLTGELYRRLYLRSQIAQAFLDAEIQQPTDPYKYPLSTTDPTFYLHSVENTDATASDPGTSNISLQTQRLMAMVQYSYNVDEDSVTAILPMVQNLLGISAARALENAIINGDTTSTHQDSDVTLANDARKAWKGFRKLALAPAANALSLDISSGGVSRANLTALLKKLGKWGSNTSDLLWIVGPKTWTALLGLDEFALAYARGTSPTFSAGAPLSSPYGGQIVVSEQCREDLNATGVYDGSTTTKGSILLVHKPSWLMGSRREFMVESEQNKKSQTNSIIASFRKSFTPVETPAATTAQTVAVAFNYNS